MCDSDSALFKFEAAGEVCYLLLYVDDILILSKDKALVAHAEKILMDRYSMTKEDLTSILA